MADSICCMRVDLPLSKYVLHNIIYIELLEILRTTSVKIDEQLSDRQKPTRTLCGPPSNVAVPVNFQHPNRLSNDEFQNRLHHTDHDKSRIIMGVPSKKPS